MVASIKKRLDQPKQLANAGWVEGSRETSGAWACESPLQPAEGGALSPA